MTDFLADNWGVLAIPVFAGVIGYVTNYLAIRMMFHPLTFWGYKFPFKVLGFPFLGWQGIIPSKAAKMGSIAVDTGLMKLGTTYEFYKEMDPDLLAELILEDAQDDVREIIDGLIDRHYPRLPGPVRTAAHNRVQAELPAVIRHLTHHIGENIDSLVNLKLMVIRHLESDPRLLNSIFQEVGRKEFRFIINSGAWLGVLLGIGPMLLWIAVPEWWAVPLGAAAVGYGTNWIALRIIFEPSRPIRVGPFTLFGLFLRRQAEVAEAYAEIIAYKIVTLRNIGEAMFTGPSGDRTRRLIADQLKPVIDRSIGPAKLAIRATGRGATLDGLHGMLAERGVNTALTTLTDEEFGQGRAILMKKLLATRMAKLPPHEFAVMLRSAFQEDEWQLVVVGALLGFLAGLAQVFLTL
ncbi:MAG: hypothetical protein GEU93_17435 [Propionibacteriales bacterium]|nr:hypothetical protein [Propionibacteriales bacterium]